MALLVKSTKYLRNNLNQFYIVHQGQRYSNTKTRQRHFKKRKLQTDFSILKIDNKILNNSVAAKFYAPPLGFSSHKNRGEGENSGKGSKKETWETQSKEEGWKQVMDDIAYNNFPGI